MYIYTYIYICVCVCVCRIKTQTFFKITNISPLFRSFITLIKFLKRREIFVFKYIYIYIHM